MKLSLSVCGSFPLVDCLTWKNSKVLLSLSSMLFISLVSLRRWWNIAESSTYIFHEDYEHCEKWTTPLALLPFDCCRERRQYRVGKHHLQHRAWLLVVLSFLHSTMFLKHSLQPLMKESSAWRHAGPSRWSLTYWAVQFVPPLSWKISLALDCCIPVDESMKTSVTWQTIEKRVEVSRECLLPRLTRRYVLVAEHWPSLPIER